MLRIFHWNYNTHKPSWIVISASQYFLRIASLLSTFHSSSSEPPLLDNIIFEGQVRWIWIFPFDSTNEKHMVFYLSNCCSDMLIGFEMNRQEINALFLIFNILIYPNVNYPLQALMWIFNHCFPRSCINNQKRPIQYIWTKSKPIFPPLVYHLLSLTPSYSLNC